MKVAFKVDTTTQVEHKDITPDELFVFCVDHNGLYNSIVHAKAKDFHQSHTSPVYRIIVKEIESD